MISLSALTIVVYCALTVTIATPIGLMILLLRDYQRGKMW